MNAKLSFCIIFVVVKKTVVILHICPIIRYYYIINTLRECKMASSIYIHIYIYYTVLYIFLQNLILFMFQSIKNNDIVNKYDWTFEFEMMHLFHTETHLPN